MALAQIVGKLPALPGTANLDLLSDRELGLANSLEVASRASSWVHSRSGPSEAISPGI